MVLLLTSFLLAANGIRGQVIVPVTGDTSLTEPLENSEVATPQEASSSGRSDYHAPPLKPVARREVDQKKWEDAAKGLDYSKDVPRMQKQQTPANHFNPDWNGASAGLGQLMQILAIMIAIAGIGYGIYRTLQSPRNRRIGQAEDGTIITLENVDAYIHETDLERFLREALAAGNYPLGIRLYYLQIIKLLSEKEAIRWSRAKTNRDYLREMKDHRLGRAFREATRHYERVWYGNEALDGAGFSALEPSYKQLIASI